MKPVFILISTDTKENEIVEEQIVVEKLSRIKPSFNMLRNNKLYVGTYLVQVNDKLKVLKNYGTIRKN